MKIQGEKPKIDGKIRLKAQVQYDAKTHQAQIQNFEFSSDLKGEKLPDRKLNLHLTTEKFLIPN